jgi:hypothetical protein
MSTNLPAVSTRPTVELSESGVVLRNLDDLGRVADMIWKSGLAPKGDDASTIGTKILFGIEVGLSMMTALNNISVINGRPSIYGDAVLSRIMSSPVFDFDVFDEHFENEPDNIANPADNFTAVITMGRITRTGATKVRTERFSVADAKRAKLWGKSGPWTEHPKRMLLWRPRTFLARNLFADLLRGYQIAEEAMDLPHIVREAVIIQNPPVAPPAAIAAPRPVLSPVPVPSSAAPAPAPTHQPADDHTSPATAAPPAAPAESDDEAEETSVDLDAFAKAVHSGDTFALLDGRRANHTMYRVDQTNVDRNGEVGCLCYFSDDGGAVWSQKRSFVPYGKLANDFALHVEHISDVPDAVESSAPQALPAPAAAVAQIDDAGEFEGTLWGRRDQAVGTSERDTAVLAEDGEGDSEFRITGPLGWCYVSSAFGGLRDHEAALVQQIEVERDDSVLAKTVRHLIEGGFPVHGAKAAVSDFTAARNQRAFANLSADDKLLAMRTAKRYADARAAAFRA